jgi:hypothetical protein
MDEYKVSLIKDYKFLGDKCLTLFDNGSICTFKYAKKEYNVRCIGCAVMDKGQCIVGNDGSTLCNTQKSGYDYNFKLLSDGNMSLYMSKYEIKRFITNNK